MNQDTNQETNKPRIPQKDTALHDHIKARITRKPNRIIKRSFIESAMCNHNIVMLLMGMLVFVGILGIYIMPKQEMPQFTIRQGACVAVYPGATSDEVEERVAKPLENFIFGYKEVNKKKTYTQSKDGMLIVFLELNDDVEDRDAFWSKFKHGLQAFKASLPSGVLALQAVDDIADTSALLITMESKQKTYRELNTYIDRLKDRLRRIDAILITGFDVSITCILGVVSLMGILVRNGIIMLDYAEELRRDKGLAVRDAAFQAGERRMRPIFLTSAAASVGVLPMMIENNTLWSPMGAVIFFGTLISMVLIATILPVLYWIVFDKHGKYSLRKKTSCE